jgi:hypothetical protein
VSPGVDETGSEHTDDLDVFDARLRQDRSGRVVTFRHAQLAALLEHEQLVRAAQRVLAGDVDDGARQAVSAARIFALWARFAAW